MAGVGGLELANVRFKMRRVKRSGGTVAAVVWDFARRLRGGRPNAHAIDVARAAVKH